MPSSSFTVTMPCRIGVAADVDVLRRCIPAGTILVGNELKLPFELCTIFGPLPYPGLCIGIDEVDGLLR